MKTDHVEPLAVSPAQAAFLTSLSKRKVQDLMTRGVIPFRKVGRRTLIPFGALKTFLHIDCQLARVELKTKMEARTGA